MRSIFLACPYSHADPAVTQQRFEACNEVAARILARGAVVYSQVSMSHPINLALPANARVNVGALWGPVDEVFMGVLDELIILDLPGWDASSGIRREIEVFEAQGKRVSLWSSIEDEFNNPA